MYRIFDLGPRFGLMALNVPKMAQSRKYNFSFFFLAKVFTCQRFTQLTMTNNVVGPKFWFSTHLRLWRTPKKVKNSDFSSFKLGISFLQGLLVYPRATILLNWILDFGPCLRFMAQNVPKMALNQKNWTPPTVFELGSSSLRGSLTYPRPKNWWSGFLIWGPVWDLWPKTCPKWP